MVAHQSPVTSHQSPLYGLILSGGRSRRMGRDKGGIKYHGVPQVEFTHKLLSELCPRVFVSCRKDQSNKLVYRKFAQIHDRREHEGIGPLAGILSAMRSFPRAAWLVVACDLPFLTTTTLRTLVRCRNSQALATVYQSQHGKILEPLCAIYEPAIRPKLSRFYYQGVSCPRKILLNLNVPKIPLREAQALDNINLKKELRNILQLEKIGKAARKG